jgi:hypothetical protein
LFGASFAHHRQRRPDESQSFREVTEADISAALREASFEGWPGDEGDLLELVNIVIAATHITDPELNAEPLIGTAYEPYRFLARVR